MSFSRCASRRAVLSGAFLVTLSAATSVSANNVLLAPAMPSTPPLKRAFVAQPALVQQQCAEWCWAASIAMIFGSNGHPMDQQAIVQRVFNVPVCAPTGAAPAGAAGTIAAALSSNWIDQNRQPFQSVVTAAYDPANGVSALPQSTVVDDLTTDFPLIVCNLSHCMMLVACDYFETMPEPTIRALGVLDPFPYGGRPAGFRWLSPPEALAITAGGQLTFLATVRTI